MPCVQHRCMGEVLRSFNGACDIIIHPPLQTTGGIEGIAATPGQRLGPQVLALCRRSITIPQPRPVRMTAMQQSVQRWGHRRCRQQQPIGGTSFIGMHQKVQKSLNGSSSSRTRNADAHQIVADEIFGSSVDEHRQARLQQEGDLGCVVPAFIHQGVRCDKDSRETIDVLRLVLPSKWPQVN